MEFLRYMIKNVIDGSRSIFIFLEPLTNIHNGCIDFHFH